MSKYRYEGITYHTKRYTYKGYELKYETYKKEGFWHAISESWDDKSNIDFLDSKEIKAEEMLFAWYKAQIDGDKAHDLMHPDTGHNVFPAFEDILYGVRDNLICYHQSETENRQSILTKGIIANGRIDHDVVEASKLLGKVKPFYIPKWVDRLNSIYAWPEFDNALITRNTFGNANRDLYAILNLDVSRCWVGSQGMGGLCWGLNDIDPNWSEETKKEFIENRYRCARTYWRHSCSLKSYLKNEKIVKYKNDQVGLDEILINYAVSPKDIVLIASWDEQGNLQVNNEFTKFVKDKFKTNYQEILSKY